NSTAFLPASIASLNRPSFISAMPSACQPSKKSGAISTLCRYFAAALSKSPTARSPLASSKISSGDCSIEFVVFARKPFGAVNSLAFARLQASRLLAVVQPFVKNDALLVIEKSFFKRCLLLGSICICRWLPLFQNCNEPVFIRWGKIADLTGVQECHGIFNGGKIGHARIAVRSYCGRGRFVLLRFFVFGFCFLLLD